MSAVFNNNWQLFDIMPRNYNIFNSQSDFDRILKIEL
jgi:hypothetical protein